MTIQHENAKLTRAGYPPLADCEPLHTPGPWTLRKSDTARPESRRVDIVTTFGEFAPAFIVGDALPADAALISAAPELLSALQQAYNAIAWDIPGGNLSDEEEEALLDTLRAAIAKAEGGVK